MVQSNHLKQKAGYFGIDLSTSSDQGMVLVCRYMLDGISHSLLQDPRKIPREYIDVLEEDLREIGNEFSVLSAQKARNLMKLKLIKSVSAIIAYTEKAHTEVCTASMMIDNGSSETNYISYFNCLKRCLKAINSARQCFLI